MEGWQIDGGFGFENLKKVQLSQPEPAAGEVLLKIRAVSLNYRDLLMIRGHYNPRQPLPLIPGSDAVGEVVALGEGVPEGWLGKRVIPIFAQGWLSGPMSRAAGKTTLGGPVQGTYRQYMTIPAEAMVEAPSHLTDAEAATLPCAGVTAWRALVTEGQLKAGQTVLTLGTGGVSIFALQIAKMLGAKVAITSSSVAKLARVTEEFGADFTMNYREDVMWGKTVRKWAPEGVDVVVELGGAGTFNQSLRAVRVGGTVALIGVLDGVKTDVMLTKILMSGIKVQGILVGDRQDLRDLCAALQKHPEVRPVVDEIFEFDALPQAFDYMAAGRHFGKIVVAVP